MDFVIEKPQLSDLSRIEKILQQWLELDEVSKYLRRIQDDIEGEVKYDMRFWVIRVQGKASGVIGLADYQPKLEPYVVNKKSKEIKAVFVNREQQKMGLGRRLIEFVEGKARRAGWQQLLLVSAGQFKETAYGFYLKCGFVQVGQVMGGTKDKKMAVFSKNIT